MSPAAGHEDDEHGGYQISRVLALSDGVFAIALTLLAFSLRVAADVKTDRLGDVVRNQWPVLFAYGLSVAVVGGFWVGHHRAFSHIARVDTGLLWINFAFLGLLALIPYPTDLLGASRRRRRRSPLRRGGQRGGVLWVVDTPTPCATTCSAKVRWC